jgi:hypothetical protein
MMLLNVGDTKADIQVVMLPVLDALKRVRFAGQEVAIAELEVQRNLLLRTRRYLEVD